MHTFQCKPRGLDLQLSNKKVVTFKNFEYQTSDDALAVLIREKCGKDIWELEKVLEQMKAEETDFSTARRGRPPKIVQGMRGSEVQQGEQT